MKNNPATTAINRLFKTPEAGVGHLFEVWRFVSSAKFTQLSHPARAASAEATPKRKWEVCPERWAAATSNGQLMAPTPQEEFSRFSCAARLAGLVLATSKFAAGVVMPKPAPNIQTETSPSARLA